MSSFVRALRPARRCRMRTVVFLGIAILRSVAAGSRAADTPTSSSGSAAQVSDASDSLTAAQASLVDSSRSDSLGRWGARGSDIPPREFPEATASWSEASPATVVSDVSESAPGQTPEGRTSLWAGETASAQAATLSNSSTSPRGASRTQATFQEAGVVGSSGNHSAIVQLPWTHRRSRAVAPRQRSATNVSTEDTCPICGQAGTNCLMRSCRHRFHAECVTPLLDDCEQRTCVFPACTYALQRGDVVLDSLHDNECALCAGAEDGKKILSPCGHVFHEQCVIELFSHSLMAMWVGAYEGRRFSPTASSPEVEDIVRMRACVRCPLCRASGWSPTDEQRTVAESAALECLSQRVVEAARRGDEQAHRDLEFPAFRERWEADNARLEEERVRQEEERARLAERRARLAERWEEERAALAQCIARRTIRTRQVRKEKFLFLVSSFQAWEWALRSGAWGDSGLVLFAPFICATKWIALTKFLYVLVAEGHLEPLRKWARKASAMRSAYPFPSNIRCACPCPGRAVRRVHPLQGPLLGADGGRSGLNEDRQSTGATTIAVGVTQRENDAESTSFERRIRDASDLEAQRSEPDIVSPEGGSAGTLLNALAYLAVLRGSESEANDSRGSQVEIDEGVYRSRVQRFGYLCLLFLVQVVAFRGGPGWQYSDIVDSSRALAVSQGADGGRSTPAVAVAVVLVWLRYSAFGFCWLWLSGSCDLLDSLNLEDEPFDDNDDDPRITRPAVLLRSTLRVRAQPAQNDHLGTPRNPPAPFSGISLSSQTLHDRQTLARIAFVGRLWRGMLSWGVFAVAFCIARFYAESVAVRDDPGGVIATVLSTGLRFASRSWEIRIVTCVLLSHFAPLLVEAFGNFGRLREEDSFRTGQKDEAFFEYLTRRECTFLREGDYGDRFEWGEYLWSDSPLSAKLPKIDFTIIIRYNLFLASDSTAICQSLLLLALSLLECHGHYVPHRRPPLGGTRRPH